MEERAIVIIGAGPAGAAAAHAAARAGIAPLLIERDATPGARSACGGVAASVFCDRLELTDAVIEREVRRTILRIDGRAFEFARSRPTYISFQRAAFDAFLADRAVEAGAELLTTTRVAAVDPAGRRLTLRDVATGREREVAAQVVIFADGPRTLAADALGIGHRPGPRTRRGMYWDLEGAIADGETIEMNVDTSARGTGYVWVFPKRDHVQIGTGGPFGVDPTSLRDRLAAFVEGRADLRDLPVRRRHAGLVPAQHARRFAADGAMVVGDAAGLVNPITGGGIALALRSGEIAGRVAAEAVRAGQTDRRGLRAYPRRFRRTPHYRWLTLMARWRRRIDRRNPSEQAAIYARTLKRYFTVFHRLGFLVDLLLNRRGP